MTDETIAVNFSLPASAVLLTLAGLNVYGIAAGTTLVNPLVNVFLAGVSVALGVFYAASAAVARQERG